MATLTLLRTPPLSEEIAEGYLGRLRVINLDRSSADTLRRLSKTLAMPLSPQILLLATAAGLDPPDFIRHHTLIPWIRSVSYKKQEPEHGSPSQRSVLQRCSMLPPRREARLCQHCIEKDGRDFGFQFSYWRRVLQIPGIECCPEHRTPLGLVGQAHAPFDQCPHTVLQHAFVPPLANSILENPVVERYARICVALLNCTSPVHVAGLGQVLGERARELDLRTASHGRRGLLSDLAVRSCPAPWLAANFPDFQKKQSLEYLNAVDACCRPNVGGSSWAYTLALAVLFDSPESAMKAYHSASVIEGLPGNTSKKMIPRGFWKSQELTELYIESGGKPTRVAAKLGLTPKHVTDQLRKVGLPPFVPARAAPIADAVLEYLAGQPLSLASERFSVPLDLLEEAVRYDVKRMKPLYERAARRNRRRLIALASIRPAGEA